MKKIKQLLEAEAFKYQIRLSSVNNESIKKEYKESIERIEECIDIIEKNNTDNRELLINFSKWLQSKNEHPWSVYHADAFLNTLT